MTVIKPPQRINTDSKNHKVFLAGSIEMGKAENWQKDIEGHFKNKPNFILLNPRRDDWDSSWEQTFENSNFYQQVHWELNALEKADTIIMYLCPETKSPISLLELGLYANSKKLLICCPTGFWRKGNVEIIADKFNIPFYETIEQLLKNHF